MLAPVRVINCRNAGNCNPDSVLAPVSINQYFRDENLIS
jgi:hypothetical protein